MLESTSILNFEFTDINPRESDLKLNSYILIFFGKEFFIYLNNLGSGS